MASNGKTKGYKPSSSADTKVSKVRDVEHILDGLGLRYRIALCGAQKVSVRRVLEFL